jgi:hypothetical protein
MPSMHCPAVIAADAPRHCSRQRFPTTSHPEASQRIAVGLWDCCQSACGIVDIAPWLQPRSRCTHCETRGRTARPPGRSSLDRGKQHSQALPEERPRWHSSSPALQRPQLLEASARRLRSPADSSALRGVLHVPHLPMHAAHALHSLPLHRSSCRSGYRCKPGPSQSGMGCCSEADRKYGAAGRAARGCQHVPRERLLVRRGSGFASWLVNGHLQA